MFKQWITTFFLCFALVGTSRAEEGLTVVQALKEAETHNPTFQEAGGVAAVAFAVIGTTSHPTLGGGDFVIVN